MKFYSSKKYQVKVSDITKDILSIAQTNPYPTAELLTKGYAENAVSNTIRQLEEKGYLSIWNVTYLEEPEHKVFITELGKDFFYSLSDN